MADPWASSCADSVIKCGFSFINKHSRYVFCFKTYAQTLENTLHDLETRRKDVERYLKEGKNKNEEPDDVVREWLEKVSKLVEEGKDLLAKIVKSKNNCFSCVVEESTEGGGADENGIQSKDMLIISSKVPIAGFVLNPWTRWRISRKSKVVANALLEEEKRTFGRYTHPRDPRGLVTGSSAPADLDPKYYFPASRQAILQEINKALISADISIVGVWGPSGVGKSTLLDEVVKRVKSGYQFDEVAKATVSRTADFERIQAELAGWLGLSERLKEISTANQKAEELKTRLNGKKILIILDDLATKIDLSEIGIPFSDGGNIKLLLTSRFEEVLQKEGASKSNFKLEPLQEEEAFELFIRTSNNHVDDEETSKLIKGLLTNECVGLPQYINELATRLRSSPLSEWEDTLKKLKHSTDLGVKRFIDGMLESSYDVLNFDEELKHLFLLGGQIGTQVISVEKLVLYGMGLGIFKGIDMIQGARVRVDRCITYKAQVLLLVRG